MRALVALVVLASVSVLLWRSAEAWLGGEPPESAVVAPKIAGAAPAEEPRAQLARPLPVEVAAPTEGSRSPATPTAEPAEASAKPARKIDYTLFTEELAELVQDPALTVDERVHAALLLSRKRERNGPDPRTPELVRSLIDLAVHADGEQRGHIWKALEDCRDPQLVDPLLNALVNDPDASARSEAAETLGTFADLESVRDALASASLHDLDPSVRKEAQGSLD